MKAIPMIFTTEMVKALLDGRKTVSRRPVKRFGIFNWVVVNGETGIRWVTDKNNVHQKWLEFPTSVGDLIWVRETFATLGHNDYKEVSPRNRSEIHEVRFRASEPDSISNCLDWEVRGYHWKPSIHMPRWASRLTLKVTDVRIERVQDISEEQAMQEGLAKHPQLPAWWSPAGYHTSPIYAYEELWNSIYSNWEKNPYVWVIEFEVIHQNVDVYLTSQEASCQ
jgi:hypothetical protein